MIAQGFEIKVAILGHVSVGKDNEDAESSLKCLYSEVTIDSLLHCHYFASGKTTVLNALFQDKFSEVSMRRTTAAINFFRISTCKQKNKADDAPDDDTERWSPDSVEPQEASSTLKETIADNKILRSTNEIKEKTFDIQLDEPLCEMRPDTSLVIVDIPGLNEAGSSDMYRDYVSDHWDTYDCVIVVMDAEKGVNTDEQVSLLEFVKEKQQTCNDVPVIVLCSKVDDPSNEEIASMANEVREKVEEVFNVDCSAALDKILNPRSSSSAAHFDTTSEPRSSKSVDANAATTSTPSNGKSNSVFAQTSTSSSSTFGCPTDAGNAQARPLPSTEAHNKPDSFGPYKAPWILTSGDKASSLSDNAPTASNPSNSKRDSTFDFQFGNSQPPVSQVSSSFEAFAGTSGSFGTSVSSTRTSIAGVSGSQSTTRRRRVVKPKFPSHPFSFTSWPKPQTASFSSKPGDTRASSPVVFVPISAENAFIYRTVSHLPLEDFEKLDKDIIERLGREEAGRMRWKAMTLEEKFGIVHAAVSDPSAYKERLESTNFDRFLKALDHFVGGVDTQTEVLERQLNVATRKVKGGKEGLAQQLHAIYERSKVLGKPTGLLVSQFWSAYQMIEDDAFTCFKKDLSLAPLYRCMRELIDYAKGESHVLYAGGSIGIKETANAVATEHAKVSAAAINLVRCQCMIIVEKASNWNVEDSSFMTVGVMQRVQRGSSGPPSQITLTPPGGRRQSYSLQPGATGKAPPTQHPFYWTTARTTFADGTSQVWINSLTGRSVTSKKNPDLPQLTWNNLSPDDWVTIMNSILLMAHDKHFAVSFGPEMNEFDLHKADKLSLQSMGRTRDVRKEYMAGGYVKGVFVPTDPTKYSLLRQVEMPESPANEEHWGHLAWMFCQFKRGLEGQKGEINVEM